MKASDKLGVAVESRAKCLLGRYVGTLELLKASASERGVCAILLRREQFMLRPLLYLSGIGLVFCPVSHATSHWGLACHARVAAKHDLDGILTEPRGKASIDFTAG